MSEKQKVLSLMVEKFREKHGRLPEKIVVAPVALVSLGLKKSVAPVWNDVPVECRLFKKDEVAARHEKAKVKSLGIFVKESRGQLRLAACDLL